MPPAHRARAEVGRDDVEAGVRRTGGHDEARQRYERRDARSRTLGDEPTRARVQHEQKAAGGRDECRWFRPVLDVPVTDEAHRDLAGVAVRRDGTVPGVLAAAERDATHGGPAVAVPL